MYIVIVGGGRVGRDLVDLLLEEGHDIVLIESRAKASNDIAEQYDIMVIHGDATDLKTLGEANIRDADAFVSVTGDDTTNLVACQLAQKLYDVKKTVARVNDPKNEEVFLKLGIDRAISTTRASAIYIKNQVSDMATLLSLGDYSARFLELTVPPGSKAEGRKIMELKLPRSCTFISIMRDNKMVIPEGSTIVLAGDKISALVDNTVVKSVKELILDKPRKMNRLRKKVKS